MPTASIVLPTWNGAAHLRRLLPALAAQELPGGFELLAVDSSSTDDSRALLEAAGARVRTIPQADFRHGATRNLAAEGAAGEVLVFLSQDVLPADARFLAELVAAFEDARVAGAYARVLPFPEDDPLTARTVLDAPEAGEAGFDVRLDGRRLEELAPAERARLLRFNDVASAIRASVFRERPFPDVPFGEDFAWAAHALEAGWTIRFAPRAVVHHAHRYTPRAAFERYRVDARFHREAHGHRVRPTLLSLARGLAYELRRDAAHLRRPDVGASAADWLRAPFLRGAQVLGQYWGSRGRGRPL